MPDKPAFIPIENWEECRTAFVHAPTRPSYQSLSERFTILPATISKKASDENWPLLRANAIEAKLREANAGEVLLESIGINRAVTQTAASFGLKMFQRLAETIDKLKDNAAASSDAQTLSNLAFAAANTARALKDAGIVGLPKELADAGKLGNGQWNPALLAQINVTIQNLIQASAPVTQPAASSTDGEAPAQAQLLSGESVSPIEVSAVETAVEESIPQAPIPDATPASSVAHEASESDIAQ